MVLKEEYPEMRKIGVLDALVCALEIELIRKNLSCAILSSSSLMRHVIFILSIFQELSLEDCGDVLDSS